MSIRYSNEKLLGTPIPDDGVSFGQVSANGITALVELGNVVVTGNYVYETVTLTFKGLTEPLFAKPTPNNFGGSTFSFRNRTWTVVDTQYGAKFNIAGTDKYMTWTVTGVDVNTPVLKI